MPFSLTPNAKFEIKSRYLYSMRLFINSNIQVFSIPICCCVVFAQKKKIIKNNETNYIVFVLNYGMSLLSSFCVCEHQKKSNWNQVIKQIQCLIEMHVFLFESSSKQIMCFPSHRFAHSSRSLIDFQNDNLHRNFLNLDSVFTFYNSSSFGAIASDVVAASWTLTWVMLWMCLLP